MGGTQDNRIKVLFFSAGNAVRSILAEAILNRIAPSRFQAFSAGSLPTFCLDPHALGLLRDLGYPTAHLRSKSWTEFLGDGAPRVDLVVNLGSFLPLHPLPGAPLVVEWPIPAPARCALSFITEAHAVYGQLEDRITQLAVQPLRALLQIDETRAA